MKHYLVDRRELDRAELGWGETHAILVVATDEQGAREFAASRASDEGTTPWLDPKRSSIQEIGSTDGEPRVVLSQFAD